MEIPANEADRVAISTKLALLPSPPRGTTQQSGYRVLFVSTSSARKKIFPDTPYTNWSAQLLFHRIRIIQKSNNHTHRIFSWKK